MPNAFPRTLRSMEADTFRRPLWASLLIVMVLIAWAGWFFQARLSVYENTSEAHIERTAGGAPRLVADFPPMTAYEHIRPGQSAWLRIDQYPLIPVTVAAIDPKVHEGYVHVIFVLEPAPDLPLLPGLTGSVEIEVERLSPVALVLRTAKEWLGESLDSNDNHLDHSH